MRIPFPHNDILHQLVEDVIVGEGNPHLKDIYEEMEKRGYVGGS